MTECATEDPTIEVVLIWGDGEEDTLTLGPDCVDEEGLWWNVLVLPAWTYRNTTAPPSAWVPGNVLLAATRESAVLTLTVAALAADTDALADQKALLEAALGQYPYTVQIDVTDPGGSPVTDGPWDAQPTLPQWGAMTPDQSGMFVAEGTVTIPVNPPGSP